MIEWSGRRRTSLIAIIRRLEVTSMPLSKLLEKSFNSKVSEPVNFDFEVKNEGFYLIKVVAKAGAWWQQLPVLEGKYWMDEELKVSLDETPIEPYFNGNSLYGTRQFLILFERLSPGNHSLNFKSKGKPLLEAVEVDEMTDAGKPVDLISLIENKPEDTLLSSFVSRRKNWITIVSLNQTFLYLLMKARAKDGQQLLFWRTDDEDLQLKLNGEVQKNNESKSHPFWYWCGRASKGVGKIFECSFTDQDSIHRIDILADRSPEVDQVLVSFGRIPTAADPLWTGSFDGDTEVMLLARLIIGEAEGASEKAKIWVGWTVKNRVLAQRKGEWGLTFHEVILKVNQYEAFVKKERLVRMKDPLNTPDEKVKQAWFVSYRVAVGILDGGILDPTQGASNFYSSPILQIPNWATKERERGVVDNLHFYKL